MAGMIYNSAQDWLQAKQKRVLLFGMSGLGKTHLANMLRDAGDWFHYSVDYRIGTRYMGEHIADNFKREAMKSPLLAELLRTDSVYIASNITFNNLAPLSTYLGKPGNPDLGGLAFDDYMKRQQQHLMAERAALLDGAHFIERARTLYGYDHFICDTGGSICEVVDPDDENDPVLSSLSQNTLMVWIKGSDTHAEELTRRFHQAPKPMYYQGAFLRGCWTEYLKDNNVSEHDVDPDDFVRWTYGQALEHRQPLYEKMAQNWGVTVTADDVARVKTTADFDALIAGALETATN
jgi:hypothetical protein